MGGDEGRRSCPARPSSVEGDRGPGWSRGAGATPSPPRAGRASPGSVLASGSGQHTQSPAQVSRARTAQLGAPLPHTPQRRRAAPGPQRASGQQGRRGPHRLGAALCPPGSRYVTCPIHNCSAKTLAAPFAGPVDRGSLTMQDEYIFFKVPSPMGPRTWQ